MIEAPLLPPPPLPEITSKGKGKHMRLIIKALCTNGSIFPKRDIALGPVEEEVNNPCQSCRMDHQITFRLPNNDTDKGISTTCPNGVRLHINRRLIDYLASQPNSLPTSGKLS